MSAGDLHTMILDSLHKSLLDLHKSDNTSPDYYLNHLNSQDFSLLSHPVPIIRKASSLLLCLAYRRLVSAADKELLNRERCRNNFKIQPSLVELPLDYYSLVEGCPLLRQNDIVYLWLQPTELPDSTHFKTLKVNNKLKRFQSEEYLMTYIIKPIGSGENKQRSNALWLGVYNDKIPTLIKTKQSLELLPDPQTHQVFMDIFSSKSAVSRIIHQSSMRICSRNFPSLEYLQSTTAGPSKSIAIEGSEASIGRKCNTLGFGLNRRRLGVCIATNKPSFSEVAKQPQEVYKTDTEENVTSLESIPCLEKRASQVVRGYFKEPRDILLREVDSSIQRP